MVGNMPSELTKYLDPKVLSRIKRLELQAKRVVEGFISGQHRSPFQGFSVEFASHRQYVPGDDIKHIDWKVQARTDRYYIKQYEEETNLRATFLLDASESMQYRRGERGVMSKYEYAAAIASSLALLLLGQQDAVSLAIFNDRLAAQLPASSNPNHIRLFVGAIESVTPAGGTSPQAIFHSLAEQIPRRGLVCLISDLLIDDIQGAIRALEHFRHQGHEVIVLHVMDEDELVFPFQGNTQFLGMESAARTTVQPRSIRQGYLDAVGAFLRNVKRRCIAGRMDYKLISTADHLDAALLAFLAARSAAVRKMSAKR
jgi:uncharacterized protein (DUF58 family)